MKIDLNARVAFVTGGTRGIGWACAKALAYAGATVVISGVNNQDKIERKRRELESLAGGNHLGIKCDVSNPQAVKECYTTIFKHFRRLDILVNNAGVMESGLLGITTPESIKRINDININGALYNLQYAVKLMMRNNYGSLISISSVVGLKGSGGQIVYSTSKSALIGLTKSAAKEFGKDGIRANAIAPGFIDTDLIKDFSEEKRQQVTETIALGRIGTPEDIAQSVLFLASDMAHYITGQVLGVDGGMVI
ncbi:MAG: glucose 1-dehydrogenase [Candidatus Scalindua sp. AMX11]|nr:MAG: SDR family NAD(P)-dependent oxidoreductase [Candidatus Scalindua sp.]NOG82687.1 glucose 1-dehydrogenase [Planctomycetota bacterium]RZV95261.1 MAG: glucose 1-dehydrogenase [Candidatus Scalindua sp. SCAELEC01]TDE66259.1 MAG: glucose 1-dehydrogenase [Candidatus Scalindua sp. AMX11]GJQ57882.1 MAG: 3-oxoacyl-ACP reductase [Candidatus Scalindua sp.]